MNISSGKSQKISTNSGVNSTNYQQTPSATGSKSSNSSGLKQLVNERYKQKCETIHNTIKEMVFLNAAIQMESRECKNQLSRMKVERKYLLNKLLEYEKEQKSDNKVGILQRVLSNSNSNTSTSNSSK